jgi:integrase
MGIFKKEKTWYIDYYVNGKRRREAVGQNRKMAEKVLAKRKVQIAEKRFLDVVKKPKTTLPELAIKYMEYAKTNKLSWERDAYSLKALIGLLGNSSLLEITPLRIEEYKSNRLQSVSNATVNRELACLKHMFTKAIHWRICDSNPVKSVKMLKERNERIRYLTSEEVKRLLECISARIKPIVIVALHTGMRRNEILKLKKEDIDFKQRLIFIKNSKNGKPREIPMAEQVYDALKSSSSQSKSQYVFSEHQSRHIVDIRGGFGNALRQAGIENFRFHDLRHTFASHLVMSGIDLLTVKELLGHQSINMTLRYAHLSPDHKRKAVESLKYFDGHYLDTEIKAPVETKHQGVVL